MNQPTTPIYLANSDRYKTMQYNRCGKSGLLLPQIAFGCWHNFGLEAPFNQAKELIYHAFDKGITHFDLANNYGPPAGSAETTFGRILSTMKNYRDELLISTKAGHFMWEGPYGDWGSRKHLFTSLHQSLKRLNLEYVDIFYSHRFDPNTPLDETLQALVDIVKQGKALYVGISKYPPKEAEYAFNYLKAHNTPALLYQGRYNLFTKEVEEEILPLVEKHNTGFIAFSPLAQGLLTLKYLNEIPKNSRMTQNQFLKKEVRTEVMLTKIKALNKIAQQREQSLPEMAIAWVLKDKRVSSLIMGASTTQQIDENLNALKNQSFSQEELKKIKEIVH